MASPDPDLQSQLEALLHAVREAEANWDADDKLDLALGIPPVERVGPRVLKPGWLKPPTTSWSPPK